MSHKSRLALVWSRAPKQVQISTLQEELAAVYSDNAALRARLKAAANITAATQQENERLRAEAARLR